MRVAMGPLLALAPVPLAALLYLQARDPPPIAAFSEPKTYFSEDYWAARRLFREVAAERGAALYALPIGEEGHTVDLAVLKGEGASRGRSNLLLHISGVHGVEGYAGSAVQSAWLAGGSAVPPGVTLVLVHLLNPVGASRFSRFDAENIDLNRNALPSARLERLGAPGGRSGAAAGAAAALKRLDFFFNRESWAEGLDDALFYPSLALAAALAGGGAALKGAAIVSQYEDPSRLYYGGSSRAESHEALLSWLQDHAPPGRVGRALIVDVHTGLGPSGVDTIGVDGGVGAFGSSAAARRAAADCFGDGDRGALRYVLGGGGGGDALEGYDVVEGETANYLKLMGYGDGLCVTQEFGTVPGPQVLKAVVKYRAVTRSGAGDGAKDGAAREMRAAFYPNSAPWRAKVKGRGTVVLDEALRWLA